MPVLSLTKLRRLIRKMDATISDAFEFCSNVIYYLLRGHSVGDAFRMAGDTLPQRRG